MNQTLTIAAAGAAALLAAAPAAAQDTTWSGFYVGANLGGAYGDTSLSTRVESGSGAVVLPPAEVALINAPGLDDDNNGGFSGGVHGGYNWQSGTLLMGVETDFGFFDLDQDRTRTFTSPLLITPPIQSALNQEMTTDWLWTARGRIGYATPTWLLYATAGLAVGNVQLDTTYRDTRVPPTTAALNTDETKTGWAAGVGGEYMFMPNWALRAEWMYVDLGTVRASAATTSGPAAVFTSEADARGNLWRLGVDYKF
ncbi:MAG: outer membrane beta-barrel protein [Phenylobacterium sp.]